MKKRNLIYSALLAVSVFAACKRNDDVIYDKISDNRMPIIVANTNFTSITLAAAGTTTVAGGSDINVEFNYQQTDPIKEIQFLQKIGTADSTVIFTKAYTPSFSKTKQCDTLLYKYTVPLATAAPVGTTIAVRGRVVNQNGLFKDRVFTFKTK